tara:strand:+ start:306 stop:497 length:192 start_codon:yes stop_codon:yes gene_type:complete
MTITFKTNRGPVDVTHAPEEGTHPSGRAFWRIAGSGLVACSFGDLPEVVADHFGPITGEGVIR